MPALFSLNKSESCGALTGSFMTNYQFDINFIIIYSKFRRDANRPPDTSDPTGSARSGSILPRSIALTTSVPVAFAVCKRVDRRLGDPVTVHLEVIAQSRAGAGAAPGRGCPVRRRHAGHRRGLGRRTHAVTTPGNVTHARPRCGHRAAR